MGSCAGITVPLLALAAEPSAAAPMVPGFSTFYYFATAMAVGIAAALPLVPVAEIGRRFFVLMSFLALVFLALAAAASGLAFQYLHLACAGLLIAYNVLLPPQAGPDVSERRQSAEGGPRPGLTRFSQGLLVLAFACGAAGVVLDAIAYPVRLETRVPQEPLLAAAFLGSSLVLGGALSAMVLGHWYLVARKLSFTPLARVTRLLWAALLARMAVAGIFIWAQGAAWERLVERSGGTGFLIDPGVFLLARAIFGFAAPAAFGWMALQCVRIRSNQSATGILYVTLAFVLIGELIAVHFLVSRGLVI
jgi:hypothetical protein